MATPPLTDETLRRIDLLFPPDERELVASILLEECGNNLPLLNNVDAHDMDRFRFAALKLSEGRLDKLDEALKLAKMDWRDLLMAAGFGYSIHAHETWIPGEKASP